MIRPDGVALPSTFSTYCKYVCVGLGVPACGSRALSGRPFRRFVTSRCEQCGLWEDDCFEGVLVGAHRVRPGKPDREVEGLRSMRPYSTLSFRGTWNVERGTRWSEPSAPVRGQQAGTSPPGYESSSVSQLGSWMRGMMECRNWAAIVPSTTR